ncbi:unnamed protein product, partial [Rotaria magnacalcarata]
HELSNWDGHLTEPCKADWSQYDHESLTPIQHNTKNHVNYHSKNNPAQLLKTSTLPISYYANPPFPYSTKICGTRPMMMNNSLNASTKLPIAIVPPFTK